MTSHNERECPKCGNTMEWDDEDPSTGIVAGWGCPGCGHGEAAEPYDGDDDWRE